MNHQRGFAGIAIIIGFVIILASAGAYWIFMKPSAEKTSTMIETQQNAETLPPTSATPKDNQQVKTTQQQKSTVSPPSSTNTSAVNETSVKSGREFLLTGSAPQNARGVDVVIVPATYSGDQDWTAISKIVLSSSRPSNIVDNDGIVTNGTWGVEFRNLASGNYTILVYDASCVETAPVESCTLPLIGSGSLTVN